MKMTQEKIHLEYEKIMYHKASILHELRGIGAELSALQAICTHPNKIVNKSFTMPAEYCVYEYEEVTCPDCGYFSRTVIN